VSFNVLIALAAVHVAALVVWGIIKG